MVKKRGLGKGLAALLSEPSEDIGLKQEKAEEPEKAASGQRTAGSAGSADLDKVRKAGHKDLPVEKEEGLTVREEILQAMQTLPIDRLQANPDQPRKEFDPQALEELAQSIARYGILQPIVVKSSPRKGGAPYEIVAGERRFRAAKLAGLSEVPVVLRQGRSEETALLSVVENVQREDLNPLEEALAYQSIMKQQMMTQQELADALGKSRPYVANIVRLTKLDDESMDALRRGLLTSSQARSLLAENDLKKRARYRQLLLEGRTSVNRIEGQTARKPVKDIFLEDLENRMSESLGTRVTINKKKKGWNVQVECYTEEDLNRLIDRFDRID